LKDRTAIEDALLLRGSCDFDPIPVRVESGLWYQYYFQIERGRKELTAERHSVARVIWTRNSPTWHFDEATFERAAMALDNSDYVDVVIHPIAIAAWFHIAARLQHAKQAASGLSTDEPGRLQAKTAIVAEVERLHWRIWNGKAKDAHLIIERSRKVMHVFKDDERGLPGLRTCQHADRGYGRTYIAQSSA
jgi:hypothetical protein